MTRARNYGLIPTVQTTSRSRARELRRNQTDAELGIMDAPAWPTIGREIQKTASNRALHRRSLLRRATAGGRAGRRTAFGADRSGPKAERIHGEPWISRVALLERPGAD